MQAITRDAMSLWGAGPVLDVILAPSEEYLLAGGAGSQDQPALRVSAMIDAGATTSVIDSGVARQLGLVSIDTVRVNTVGRAGLECNQYRVHLAIADEDVSFPNLLVTAASLEGQHIECLIGRDILMDALFTYDGPANSFSLTF